MSFITHIMLHISSFEEGARIAEVKRFFGMFPPQSIEDVGTVAGKSWVASVYVGAYNFLSLDELITHLRSKVAWEYPDYVQLFVRVEGERGFRVAVEIAPENPGLTEEEVMVKMLRSFARRMGQIPGNLGPNRPGDHATEKAIFVGGDGESFDAERWASILIDADISFQR